MLTKEKVSCKQLTSTAQNWTGLSWSWFTNLLAWNVLTAFRFQRATASACGKTPTPSVTSSPLRSMPSATSGLTIHPYLLAADYGSVRGTEMAMHQQAVRVALMSAQQALICLAEQPPEVLSLATFPYYPDSGECVGIHTAMALLRREISRIETVADSHRASLSQPTE
jgi:hypothetical protein